MTATTLHCSVLVELFDGSTRFPTTVPFGVSILAMNS